MLIEFVATVKKVVVPCAPLNKGWGVIFSTLHPAV